MYSLCYKDGRQPFLARISLSLGAWAGGRYEYCLTPDSSELMAQPGEAIELHIQLQVENIMRQSSFAGVIRSRVDQADGTSKISYGIEFAQMEAGQFGGV